MSDFSREMVKLCEERNESRLPALMRGWSALTKHGSSSWTYILILCIFIHARELDRMLK